MKKFYAWVLTLLCAGTVQAQLDLSKYQEPTINHDSTSYSAVVMPQSPLTFQVLFIGGEDFVQTTNTYGNAPDSTPAKQWHDFIGFTPDETGQSLGWVSVNHEMIEANDKIGDGGGMTVFRVRRDAATDSLVIMKQTLDDGRTGHFFSVDFVNTVGATGMNCGGITSVVDGRIWTAEEWFRTSNTSIVDRDTSNFVIGQGTANGQTATAGFPGFDGQEIKKFQNYNWMVEIDPRQAKAIRKQYNWGRQGFEGGVVMPDNKTVYLGVDDTPAYWVKFVATTAGDFTSGKTYVYKYDGATKWIEIDNTDLSKMLGFMTEARNAGGTMYNRIEWVALDTTTGIVYMTETGRDNPGNRFNSGVNGGATLAPHHVFRAAQQGTVATASNYTDRYGRVLKYDPATEEVSVHIAGGPEFLADSVSSAIYPKNHLSNPDGLNVMMIGKQSYLVILEDLIGISHGRVPNDITENANCELYLLDLSIANPITEDLIYVTSATIGAEITGACPTPDGKSLLINSQHPDDAPFNQYPYNNSLTFAIHGWDKVAEVSSSTSIRNQLQAQNEAFKVYPNPVARTLHFDAAIDAELYDMSGKRVRVVRNSPTMDVTGLPAGSYFVRNLATGATRKLIVE
ncbi:MAG: hypothetical protein OHK0039_36050 [Bacteroidia bacterium]